MGVILLMADMRMLLNNYLDWLKDSISFKEFEEGWVEITTPFLDRHNDQIQIYVRKEGNHYLISDDGFILRDLEQSGCRIDTSERQQIMKMTLNGFGIMTMNGSLFVKADRNDFPLKKHNLIQGMLAINDMFYMAQPIVTSIFIEDVTSWLELNEIRFIREVKFTGKSGFDHMFDFVIPRSKRSPERIIKTINRPGRDTVESFAFAWLDTREVRPPESKAFALLNDQEPFPGTVLSALENYGIIPVPWSKRESSVMELTT